MAPDYDHLTLMQKVEVFEHAVNNTAGDDLAKLLWLKSPSSEVSSARVLSSLQNVGEVAVLAYHKLQMNVCRRCFFHKQIKLCCFMKIFLCLEIIDFECFSHSKI